MDTKVIKVVNAGKCMMCGREMKVAIGRGSGKFPNVLADALMEERIRGELTSDTDFAKDVIPDVKCKLSVSIKDNRPCYCGAGLREVWRESEE